MDDAAYIQLVGDARLITYFQISSCVALLYDIYLTLPSECEIVWSTPLTWPSAMYYLMRYGSLLWQAVSLAFTICTPVKPLFITCQRWLFVDVWVSYIILIPSTIFLSLRIYSLYRDQERDYKWTMITLFAALHGVTLARSIVVTKGIASINPSRYSGSCTLVKPMTNPYHMPLIELAAITVFTGFLFTLAVARNYSYYREGNRVLTCIILKDALIYTGILFCASIATLATHTSLRTSLRPLLNSTLTSLTAIVSSRLVLNLHKIVVEPEAVTFDTLTRGPMTLDTLGEMEFRTRAQVDWEDGSLPMCKGKHNSDSGEEGLQPETRMRF